MRLAAESPYPGEQANARAAASRLAADHRMSLDEAVRAGVDPEPAPRREPEVEPNAEQWQRRGGFQRQDYRTEERPEVEELRQYARACREERDTQSAEFLRWCLIMGIGFALLELASRSGFFEFLQFGAAVP